MQPVIRPYEPTDREAAIAVVQAFYQEKDWRWDPKTDAFDICNIETYFIDKGGHFWVLADEDRVIGTIALEVRGEDVCELRRFFLLASERGKGYGRLLMQHVVDFSRAQGFKRMEIWSDIQLATSHSLYQKFGARQVGQKVVDDAEYGQPYEVYNFILDL